jgi:hypothetical protein
MPGSSVMLYRRTASTRPVASAVTLSYLPNIAGIIAACKQGCCSIAVDTPNEKGLQTTPACNPFSFRYSSSYAPVRFHHVP